MKSIPKFILSGSITAALFMPILSANAAVSFLGVASGDATSTDAIVWTRAIDSTAPTSATNITLQITTDVTFATGVSTVAAATDPAHDFTCKLNVTGLSAGTVYYYRFVGSGGEFSNVGKFKTPPAPTASVPLHFAFSGDYDGLMRPYTLGSNFTANTFDFFMNVGDTIYETASTGSAVVAATGPFEAGTGYPTTTPATSAGATASTLYADFTRKYREQFIAVNSGGQNCLQDFFAAQGNYTLLDNHELGNKQYMHGGAPAGAAIGDFSSGAGADPAATVNDVNTTGTFINKTGGFTTLVKAYTDYQPIKNRGIISAPSDPRADGTQQLYTSQQWGKNAILINTDSRSYRDLRLRTAGNVDDNGSRADNAGRTHFGATQLAWIESTLLNAQNAGTTWKFVAISNPIDQIGPIGGVLPGVTAATMQTYSGNAAYGPVSSDGGKALMGGYRAERNALLKYIADHQIKNVVFLSTDDHQNRINEILYSPTGQTSVQSSYVKVPYCFEIVDGPFGATGPDLFLNHNWTNVKGASDLIANAQASVGVNPIGLENYPGLHDVKRDQDGVLVNEATPQPADFYSPDTFNYNVLDVSADGKTLTVKGVGINSYAQNNRVEAGTGNQTSNAPRTIFQFSVDAASPLNSIDHIIVVYQENWSFDGLYGSFPGANGINGQSQSTFTGTTQLDRLSGNALSSLAASNGFNRYTGSGNETVTNTVGSPGYLNIPPQPLGTPSGSTTGVDTRFLTSPADATSATVPNTLLPYDIGAYITPSSQTGDIVHRYWQEMFQIYGADVSNVDHGNNSGFITWSDNPGLVMSHFDATNLPEGLLAQQYTMCDNFFHSSFGGSFLNHQFLVAAAAPVYTNMPGYDPVSGWAGNTGALAYLDTTGLVKANTSGNDTSGNPAVGKLIRDGSITPVVGDTMINLRIDGTGGQTKTVSGNATPSDVSFQDGSHFDKHYVVNTSFSRSLATNTTTFATSATGNLDSTSFNVTGAAGASPSPLSSNNVGMTVTDNGGNIPAGTVVTSVSGTTIGLSKKPTGTATGVTLTFSGFPLSLIPLQDNTATPLNIGDLLDNAGVSWAWYSGGWNNALDSSTTNPLHYGSAGPNTVSSLFQWHHQAFAFFAKTAPFDYTGTYADGRNPYATAHLKDEGSNTVVPKTGIYADIANNTLPSVSFVKFLGPDNEHPGYASLQQGQQHVADLVSAVQASPAVWAHTLIVITYDEHGGRWDHVTPPTRDLWGPGVRVPAILISPLAKQGYVDHKSRDTSSILSTIEQRFGLPSLNARDANAPTFADVLTSTQITRGGYSLNRRTNKVSQVVTVTNNSTSTIAGPVQLVLDSLNTTVTGAAGTTANTAPTGSPYVTASTGDLAPGASVSVTLQFTPISGGVTYSARTVTGTTAP